MYITMKNKASSSKGFAEDILLTFSDKVYSMNLNLQFNLLLNNMQHLTALESCMPYRTKKCNSGIHIIKLTNNTQEVMIMKNNKNKNNVIRKHDPTLSDLNKAAERQEFIDPEKGPENNGRKR
jgi:hypothetical protein